MFLDSVAVRFELWLSAKHETWRPWHKRLAEETARHQKGQLIRVKIRAFMNYHVQQLRLSRRIIGCHIKHLGQSNSADKQASKQLTWEIQ